MRTQLHLLLAVGILCFTSLAQSLSSTPVTITKVLEGDRFEATLESGDTFIIRLYGADVPEPGQTMAGTALGWVKERILNKTVTTTRLTKDNHGHIVAKITLANDSDLATTLLKEGLAWADSENTPKDRALKKAMVTAIQANKGLWKTPNPLAPWDYRKSHGLPPIKYQLEEPEESKSPTSPANEEEEPKVLKYKGNAPAHQPIDLSPYENLGPQEIMGLASKAQVSIKNGGVNIGNADAVPILGQLGIQNGDVITGVNGLPLTSELDVLNAVQKLQGARSVNLQLQRGGGTITLSVP